MIDARIILKAHLAVALCLSSVMVAEAAPGHIYVAIQATSPVQILQIKRFPLRGNRIQHHADLMYSNVSAPLATGVGGTLFAGTGTVAPFSTTVITRFPPNGTHPAFFYRLPVIAGQQSVATSLAVDANDTLYAGFVAGTANGVFVFPVGAHAPTRRIDTDQHVSSLAFDAQGNLCMDLVTHIAAVAHPSTNPTLVRAVYAPTLDSYYEHIRGIAADASGFVFGFNADQVGEYSVLSSGLSEPIYESGYPGYPIYTNPSLDENGAASDGELYLPYNDEYMTRRGILSSGIVQFKIGTVYYGQNVQTLAFPDFSNNNYVTSVVLGP